MSTSTTGQTADGTFELGVRRTFAGLGLDEAWRQGLALVEQDPAAGPARSRTDGEVARFPYRPDGAPRDATLQLRVLEAATGATVAIHVEGLPDAATRAALLERWTAAVEGLGAA
jgi:hypothetical protein